MGVVEVSIPKAFKPIIQKARIKTFVGGRGSGKSESVGRYLLLCGKEEPMNILCCREFQVSIKQSVHSLLSALIIEMQLDGFYQVLETEIRGINGTKFTFAGLKNNIANIKSMYNIKKCWCEEAQVLSENSINVLLPTIRAEDSEIIFTMNPLLPTDPAYQRFVINPPKDSIVVKVNYDQNPFFPEVLEKERLDLLERDPIAYRNVWLGEPREAVEGAIFAEEMQKAQDEGRIMKVPYDPSKPVDIFWDLGRADKTAMWFVQQVGYEFRLLRYYENSGQHFSHYTKLAKELPYSYGRQYLPHDADNEQLAADRTIKKQAIDAFGSGVSVVPRIPKKTLAIDAARGVFNRCVFDKDLCADGLTCLRKYAYRVDPETGKVSREPDHDTPWSHGADAFMAIGQSMLPVLKPKPPRERLPIIRRSGVR